MKFSPDKFDKSRAEIEKAIDNWIFNKRDRELVKDRLFNGITFEELAEIHNLSVRHAKTLYYKYYKKLDKKLK